MEVRPVRFECTGCGNCCRGKGQVYFTPDELKAAEDLMGLRGEKRTEFREKFIHKKHKGLLVHNTNGRCMLLGDDNRCSIYEARPLQCSTYPFWPAFFEDADEFAFLKDECEGIGRRGGKVYSELSIKRRINHTRKAFHASQTGEEKFDL